MDDNKPMLTISEQIEHLEAKGVRFEIMNKDKAAEYLTYGNNYFKVASYRKNYPKHPSGVNEGKYINLDFAYLVDLAVIDMRLRYRIVHMALDIEHHTKLKLLRLIEEQQEDGYQVVSDYAASLNKKQDEIYKSELHRNIGNPYCGSIIEKYDGHYPVWAFLEIIPFGRLVSFYEFFAERVGSKAMKNDYFNLLTCKKIRNAAAHSNCVLNDLKAKTTSYSTNASVTASLSLIPDMSVGLRKNRMSNVRIQQIVTLLYVYNQIVNSSGLKRHESKDLKDLISRLYKHEDYYESNPLISSSFVFLKKIVDGWY